MEQIPDVRRRSHWLSVQLDEEHLPGLDAPPLLQQSLEPDLSVLVTPYKSVLQVGYIFRPLCLESAGVLFPCCPGGLYNFLSMFIYAPPCRRERIDRFIERGR